MEPKGLQVRLEIIGIVAVVLSLLLLSYELNQSNRVTTASSIRDLLQNYNDLNLLILEDESIAELFVSLKSREVTDHTEVEKERIQAAMHQMVNTWDMINAAHREGLIPRSTYENNIKEARRQLQEYPGMKPYILAILEGLRVPESEIQAALVEEARP